MDRADDGAYHSVHVKACTLTCDPVSRAWDPVHARCTRTNTPVIGVVLNCFNLLTDIILLFLPVPVVMQLHIDVRRKRKYFGNVSINPNSLLQL